LGPRAQIGPAWNKGGETMKEKRGESSNQFPAKEGRKRRRKLRSLKKCVPLGGTKPSPLCESFREEGPIEKEKRSTKQRMRGGKRERERGKGEMPPSS